MANASVPPNSARAFVVGVEHYLKAQHIAEASVKQWKMEALEVYAIVTEEDESQSPPQP